MRALLPILLVACGDPGPEGLLDVATSGATSAVVDAGGGVWAWGRVGALVDGVAVETSTEPVRLDGFRDGAELCFGQGFGVLRLFDGAMVAWDFADPQEPYVVQGLVDAKALACGDYQVLAIDDAGAAWVLAAAGTSNALGARFTLEGFPPLSAGDCGDTHCAFIDEDGSIWTWGGNDRGQLGTGTTTALTAPFLTPLTTGATSVSVGGGHTLAIANDEVWGWGRNEMGQLGMSDADDRLAPTRIGALAGVTHVAAGTAHSLARFADRTVAAMGANERGQLGAGAITTEPVTFPGLVAGLDDATAVWAGGDNGLADSGASGFVGWGANESSQLGTDSFTESAAVQIIGPVGE